MKCPACQTESSGTFCPECGTPLKLRCRSCDTILAPAARYCTECGKRVGGARANAPWWLAGAALVALIVVIILPGSRSRAVGEASAPAQTVPLLDGGADSTALAAGEGQSPPPLTGTPRQQADRLFNLIMQSQQAGDTARAKFFVPMGIQAYGMAGDLDADGLFHLSLLQTLGGNGADGRATAEKILARSPTNLLGLVAAAEGAAAAGNRAAARDFYERFLAAWPGERGRDLPEYRDHAAALPEYRAEAERFLAHR